MHFKYKLDDYVTNYSDTEGNYIGSERYDGDGNLISSQTYEN